MVVEKYGAIEGGNQALARLAGYVTKIYQGENHAKYRFVCTCVTGWFCCLHR